MKVRDIMTPNPSFCREESTLASAARLMWDGDFGALPVVDRDEKVIGVITDRDICMATWMRNEPESRVTVGDVVSGPVHRCRAEDDLPTPLAIMREAQVRRLPVVDKEGKLQGMLSVNDIILAAEDVPKAGRPTCKDVVAMLKAICEHRSLSASL